ncbi:Uncharacterised protein [Mycobacterium tuberculosis]|nr:Uncharacterised protein [Mycobacterium tuberculosis]SGO43438.1 Uncharacterised protein [Mycobacterium tuberculosis]
MLCDRRKIRDVAHRHSDVLSDAGSADTGQRLFTSSVDVEYEHLVSGIQRTPKLSSECLCPRIQMGLKHNHAAATVALFEHHARRRQCRADLRRVVGVVIEHAHRRLSDAAGPNQFESSPHSFEAGQPVEHLVGRGADLHRGQQRSQRVERHVSPGHRQPHHAGTLCCG